MRLLPTAYIPGTGHGLGFFTPYRGDGIKHRSFFTSKERQHLLVDQLRVATIITILSGPVRSIQDGSSEKVVV